MNKSEWHIIEKEVRRIADELIATAKESPEGMYWETLHREPYGPLYPQVNEEIYNGVSGIALFFIALFDHTNEQRYLEIAKKNAQWLHHYVTHSNIKYYTYYTGATGVVYVYLKLFEATGNTSYLDTASEMVDLFDKDLIQQVNLDDLLSGHAGNLLVLAKLYQHTLSAKDLQRIQRTVAQITAHARLSGTGIKWGYKDHALDSFTGMSHGAAGIGYALMETGAWMEEVTLVWLAHKAFLYEDEYFSKTLNTWIDLRIFPAHEAAASTNNLELKDYFSGRPDVNTWAHGIAGMGMARLRAFQLTRNARYKKSVHHVINRMLKEIPSNTLDANYTLSTGYGSWMIFLQQASVVLKNPALSETAFQLGLQAIQQYQQTGYYPSAWYMNQSDPALMVGTAGVGYALLTLLRESPSDTILTPALPSHQHITLKNNRKVFPNCKEAILAHHFERTLQLLAHLQQDLEVLFLLQQSRQEWRHFYTAMLHVIKKLPGNKAKVVREIFKQEWNRFAMSANPSLALYRERYVTLFRQWAEKPEDWTTQKNTKFILSKHVTLLSNQWYWEGDAGTGISNFQQEPDFHPVILRAEAAGVHELYPTSFCFVVLKALSKARSIEELSLFIAQRHKIKDLDLLQEKVQMQLNYCLQQWLVQVVE